MHKITLWKRHLYVSVLFFQQQRFLKYSRSYWVNSGLQGCQGSVDRICFPQQLLSWTRSSTQHLCWAPSDDSLWVYEVFFKVACLCSFRKKHLANAFLMISDENHWFYMWLIGHVDIAVKYNLYFIVYYITALSTLPVYYLSESTFVILSSVSFAKIFSIRLRTVVLKVKLK